MLGDDIPSFISERKESLQHRPIDQFNGKKPKPSKVISVTARQRRFHKQLYDMLLSVRDDNQPFDSIGPVVNGATIVSAEGEMKEEASDDDVEAPKWSLDGKTPMGFQEKEHIMLDGKRTPYLHRLFLTEKKVSYRLLTTLF